MMQSAVRIKNAINTFRNLDKGLWTHHEISIESKLICLHTFVFFYLSDHRKESPGTTDIIMIINTVFGCVYEDQIGSADY